MLARTRTAVARGACRRVALSTAAASNAAPPRIQRPVLGSGAAVRRKVTLIRGDGIGPEVVDAAVQAMVALRVPVDWESFEFKHVDPYRTADGRVSVIEPELRESMERNKYVLKGPLITPLAQDLLSPDIVLGKELKLHSHVVVVKRLPGIRTRHEGVDLVIVRENTEGEYSGLEHVVTPGVVQSIRVISRAASLKTAECAFEFARANARKRVTCVHKANIMKKADGLFLESCREVAKGYEDIEFNDIIIDNCAMQLVSKPEQFDVLVTPNLYGNLLSEAAAGLVGGVGLVPGFNVGPGIRVYEQGPRHAGVDIAGRNTANPTGTLLASAYLLDDLGLAEESRRLVAGVNAVLLNGDANVLTPDLGGKGLTSTFAQAVVDAIPPHEAAM